MSYLLGIFRALGQSSIARRRVLWISGAQYPAAFFLEADGCLHLSQLERKGNHVCQVAFTSGRGQGIDTLAHGDSWWRVSDTSRLGVVVIGWEEVIFQVIKARVGLLHEGDPAVSSGLGQFLLGDGDQAGVASVANGPVAQLGVCRDRAKQDEGACNVGDLVWVVDANAATEEEIDDAYNGYVSALALLVLLLGQHWGSHSEDVCGCSSAPTFLEHIGRHHPFAAVRLNSSFVLAGILVVGLEISLGLGWVVMLLSRLVVPASRSGPALLVTVGDGNGVSIEVVRPGETSPYLVTVSSKVVCTLSSTFWAFPERCWSASSSLRLSPVAASLELVMTERYCWQMRVGVINK